MATLAPTTQWLKGAKDDYRVCGVTTLKVDMHSERLIIAPSRIAELYPLGRTRYKLTSMAGYTSLEGIGECLTAPKQKHVPVPSSYCRRSHQ